MADELDEIAAGLFVLPPAEFTAARDARVKAATGDLARGLKALRKPTVAAWAVNLLVQDGQLAEAVELSHALHEAQDDLDAAALATLGRQRRALVAGLARRAAQLAEDAGSPLSAATRDEVERTVNAAVVDETVAAAVLTGRLQRIVTAEDAAPADAVGGSVPGVAARPEPSRDDLAERRARKAAEAAARDADRAASDAGRELARVQARLDKARGRADHLHERIEEVRADLARLTDDAAHADGEVDRLDAERAEAAERTRTAEAASVRARAALEDGS